jgi:hypothetical protein
MHNVLSIGRASVFVMPCLKEFAKVFINEIQHKEKNEEELAIIMKKSF